MTPNPRAEDTNGWSLWQRDARGRFSRHRGGESGQPKYSRGYEAFHFQYLDSDYLNALESRLARAEALAGLAKEIAHEFCKGPAYVFDPKYARDWLARYAALASSESWVNDENDRSKEAWSEATQASPRSEGAPTLAPSGEAASTTVKGA